MLQNCYRVEILLRGTSGKIYLSVENVSTLQYHEL